MRGFMLIRKVCVFCVALFACVLFQKSDGKCEFLDNFTNPAYVGGADLNVTTGLTVSERTALKGWFGGGNDSLARAITNDLIKRASTNPVIYFLSALQHSENFGKKSDCNELLEQVSEMERLFIEGAVKNLDSLSKAIDYIKNNVLDVVQQDEPNILELMLTLISNNRHEFLICLRGMLKSGKSVTAHYLWGRIFARGELGFPKNLGLARRCIEFCAKRNYVLAQVALDDWDAFISVPAVQQDADNSKTLLELLPLPY